MRETAAKLVSMPQSGGVGLLIYGSLAFDYLTFDENKFAVMPIFSGAIQRDEDNAALMDPLGGLMVSA